MSAWSRHRAPPGRIAYVDGRYVRHAIARVHIEDRGLQLADSIYEAFSVVQGRVVDATGHLNRLERSLRELAMTMPVSRASLSVILRELVRRNHIGDGFLYLQVTRGAVKRDHAIPATSHPTLIVTARPFDTAAYEKRAAAGIGVATAPDNRWGRCDIKTTALIPNVLAKTDAKAKGAYEVWLVDKDGFVTEGGSTSAWIVTKDGRIVTRDLGANILPGVTRATLLRAAEASGSNAKCEERAFTVAEALDAQEAFLTAASAYVMPVVAIDGQKVGDGKPGPVTKRLQSVYRDAALRDVL